MVRDNSRRGALTAVFALSLAISLGLGLLGPRILGLNSRPSWMLWTELAFGLLAALTVPFAWRWLYRKPAA